MSQKIIDLPEIDAPEILRYERLPVADINAELANYDIDSQRTVDAVKRFIRRERPGSDSDPTSR